MPSHDPIRFNQTTLEGRELDYIRQAIEQGHTSSSGPFSHKVEELLVTAHDAADVLLTTSCTDALEMSALLLDVEPGDKVIVPSYTFVSTALPYARQGAEIVFADIEPDTLALDPTSVAGLLDPAVRAVITVHYAGIGGDVDGLISVMPDDVELVEDNAHGLFGRIGAKTLGTFGRFSALSFHETKNFVCGEGGALVLRDEGDVDRAHILYDKGTNRRQFFLGRVDKYSWQDTGSSFGMSDVSAAYLLAQLEQKEIVLAKRRAVFDAYVEHFSEVAPRLGLTLPSVPDDRSPAYHMFYLLCPSRSVRDTLLAGLAERGITGTFHYVPLHSAPGGRKFSSRQYDCPVTDDISGRLIRLPFHNALTTEDQERVAEAVVTILEGLT